MAPCSKLATIPTHAGSAALASPIRTFSTLFRAIPEPPSSLTSLVPLGLAMPFVAHAHSPPTFAAIAGLSLAGGIAQLALTGALRLAPVSLVMPMDYSALLWASILGLALFGQAPSHWTWLGAPIVIAAGLVILWREQRLRRSGSATVAVPEVSP